MSKRRNFVVTKFALTLAILPIIIHAYETGPDPRRTGAPGDSGTCLGSGCHTGTRTGPGNVRIVLPGGNTYTPGLSQHIMVQITDATRQKFGFELTARLAGDLANGQAGDFTTTDALTQVICEDSSTKKNGSPCPAQFPVQFIEHDVAGYLASTAGSYTYQFDWTPPATNAGNVTLYVAANAGPGGPPVSTNADVYTSTVTLTPAAVSGPTIANVQDAESARTTVVPGEWVAIYGQNLAPPGIARTWQSADFTSGNALPASLSGVSVQFNGLPAAVYYISPTQIDVQAPAGIGGTVPVVVTNNGAISAAFNTTVVANAPSLFFYAGGATLYPAATHLDGSLIGDPAVTPGASRAAPGETIVLYVNGIASSPSGTIITAPIAYSGGVSVTVGTLGATVGFAGLVAAGEYQLNVTMPNDITAGNYPVTVQTQGQSSAPGITLLVGPG